MDRKGVARLPDWIVIGQEAWDDVERRNQLLVRALAERHPRSRFLFSEQPLRLREIRQWRVPRPRQVAPNIWALRPLRPLPDRFSRERSDRLEAAQLRRASKAVHLEQPWIWTQDPRSESLIDLLPGHGLVYDLTDDWAAFEPDPDARAQVQARIERLGRRADAVLACSRSLERGAREWSDRVTYVPNAVEPPADPGPEPADLAAIARPRVGYAGTLHSSRLDVELIAQAAAERPAWSFVLLGPDALEPPHHDRLAALPNVHFLGARPHRAVRAYLAGFDICLLPNLVNDFTRSLDPLKLYEYLAAGRPVLTTPVDNTPELAEHLEVVHNADELTGAADRLLTAVSDEDARHRQEAVSGATWEARAQEVEEAIGLRDQPVTDEVSIAIVSFNTRELLERCLTDVYRQVSVATQVIVVDNASTDGSVAMVREKFPQIEVIELDENCGFGAANNVAFERCRGRYVLLLNTDAFLTSPDSVQEMVAAAERHPEAGAVGPRLLNPDGSLQRSAWPFPSVGRLWLEALGMHRVLRSVGLLEDLGLWDHDEERTVDFLVGACLLLRREALLGAGGFDENFWLYGEEADLQKRLAARGWTSLMTPETFVTHVGGASSTPDSIVRLRHFYRGQFLFLRKHQGWAAPPLARIALIVGSAIRGRWAACRAAGVRLQACGMELV